MAAKIVDAAKLDDDALVEKVCEQRQLVADLSLSYEDDDWIGPERAFLNYLEEECNERGFRVL